MQVRHLNFTQKGFAKSFEGGKKNHKENIKSKTKRRRKLSNLYADIRKRGLTI